MAKSKKYKRELSVTDPALPHNKQGIALAHQGRWPEAAACFQEAIRLNPASADGHNNLANIFLYQTRFTDAITHYKQSLQLSPNAPVTWNNLSYAYQKAGNAAEAEVCARRALALQPNLAEAHNHLGIAIESQGKSDEASVHYQEALRLRPEFPDALNNFAGVLRGKGRYEEARARSEKALRLDPNLVEAFVNLGHVYLETGDFARASALCEEALRRKPNLVEPRRMQGLLAMKEGRLDAALAHFDDALRLQPDDAETHFSRASVLLLKGDLVPGWHEYTWRWRLKQAQRLSIVMHTYHRPFWTGSAVAGKTVHVHAEQGVGDVIQFLRYLPLVKNLGATVTFGCPERLIPLARRCAGFDRIIALSADLPECDEHSPLMNLPGIFHTTLETIPGPTPYLFAEPDLVEKWRRELAGFSGRKIGIAWQGNAQERSLPLRCFAPLARLPGVHLLSLQKGAGSEQIADVSGQFQVTDLGSGLDSAGAFLDTAAVMMNLDLVITCDTGIAHLAGALGRPVWVAIGYAPDWRWMLDREDSPWYPTMRLFRQPALGRWDDVLERMAGEWSRETMALLKTPIEDLKELSEKGSDPLNPRSPVTCILPTVLHNQGGQTPFRIASQPERGENPVMIPPLPPVLIEVAPGELLDKIAILEIKKERIADVRKLANVCVEHEALARVREQAIPASEEVARLAKELKAVNQAIWQIEDDVRACEKVRDFGPRFIELARSVYRNNDARAALKRKINELLGSKIVEEKSYAD